METLGVWLRRAREAQERTLEEAEKVTRVRARFLKALETGDLAVFPGGDVQIRGFLRIYARYLGLSPDEALTRFGAERGAAKPASPSASGTSLSQSPRLTSPSPPRWISLETLLVAGIVLILLTVLAAGGWYVMRRERVGEKAVATATMPASTSSSLPFTPAPTQLSPLVTPTLPTNSEDEVAVKLEAAEHVWGRVTVDGKVAFEGILAPEQVETWFGQEAVVVESGNGAGLMVTVNGQLQGALCGRGEICRRAWGPEGEMAVDSLTPTSTP